MLKPKNAPEVNIQLVEIEKYEHFTDCTEFSGAKMYDTHSLEETNDGVLIKNKLVVKGPLTPVWVKLVANKVAESIPTNIDALVNLARGLYV